MRSRLVCKVSCPPSFNPQRAIAPSREGRQLADGGGTPRKLDPAKA